MESFLPLIFASVVGFQHAFDVDHLVAVSNIVSKRSNVIHAIKDGIFWGLGHISTIFIVGILIIGGKLSFSEQIFRHLETIVGVMLVFLGLYRLGGLFIFQKQVSSKPEENSNHQLAYGVGAVHGLAGSGAMILMVMTEIKEPIMSLVYLSIFGVGSIFGMLILSGFFYLPFSKNLSRFKLIQTILLVVSSIFCIVIGLVIFSRNIYG